MQSMRCNSYLCLTATASSRAGMILVAWTVADLAWVLYVVAGHLSAVPKWPGRLIPSGSETQVESPKDVR